MTKHSRFPQRSVHLSAVAFFTLSGSWSAGFTQSRTTDHKTLQVHETAREKATLIGANPEIIPRSIPSTPIKNTYILGPGDQVVVEILDVPEYSGIFTIGPDGTIYLPRLRSLLVEGLTIEELSELLTQKFSSFVLDPQVFVSPASYRPIRVYIGGEVQRPGYYHLSGQQGIIGAEKLKGQGQPRSMSLVTGQINTNEANFNSTAQVGPQIEGVIISRPLTLPTVFDALRIAGGVTPFSKLVRYQSHGDALSAEVEK